MSLPDRNQPGQGAPADRPRAGAVLAWAALAAAIAVPTAFAATSPQLAWRGPVYIVAGLAGVAAMALLLVQPLLIANVLPGLSALRSRHLHRWTGGLLVAAVVVHLAGLWITSPPDVIDALVFNSPTPFSPWGVVAMWAVFAAALLAVLRRRLRLSPRTWRLGHVALVTVTVIGSTVHALLIVGTMETVSKAVLCALVVAATAWAVYGLWRR